MVEVASPGDDSDYMHERPISGSQNNSAEPDYYSSLEEK